jgi:hypothetical protein
LFIEKGYLKLTTDIIPPGARAQLKKPDISMWRKGLIRVRPAHIVCIKMITPQGILLAEACGGGGGGFRGERERSKLENGACQPSGQTDIVHHPRGIYI